MIERYCRPQMNKIWSKEGKFSRWLEIELAVLKVRWAGEELSWQQYEKLEESLEVNLARLEELESETRHDMIAFIEMLGEQIEDNSARFIHHGLTSSDIKDTARALQIKESLELIQEGIARLKQVVAERAREHKMTPMVGRTHGIQAEPVSLGLKLANWYSELNRQEERLQQLISRAAVGKISGAVGTYSGVDPDTEKQVCRELGIIPAPISSQIVQRDRQAELINFLALLAASLEKFAEEIRNLQRSEISEVEEGFHRRQKGSSAMPHKKNPIICERICGLARVVRGNSQPGLENVSLWHERDLTHSSVERIILPDSLILLDYMLAKFKQVLSELKVHEKNMKANMNITNGLIFSQRVLLTLMNKGLCRQEAYEIVQELAWQVWEEDAEFKEILHTDERIASYLEAAEIEEIFDYENYLQHVEEIFERVGL